MIAVGPKVYRVANGWHAGSEERNLAVWGATEEEARSNFASAIKKCDEILARDDQKQSGHSAAPDANIAKTVGEEAA